jgi:hypothetical protein
MSVREVAEEVGVSVRTVRRRRIAVMAEGKTFFLLPLPDLVSWSACYATFGSTAPTRERGERWTGDLSELKRVIFSKTSMKDYVFSALCDNLEDAERTRRWIESLEGVQSVRSGFLRGLIPITAWLDESIESKLEGRMRTSKSGDRGL